MSILLALPIFTALLVVQTAVMSQMPLLRGTPDLVLLALLGWTLQKKATYAWAWALAAGLMVGYVSGLPLGAAPAGYLLAIAPAELLRRRIWRGPVLSMLLATLLGTLLAHAVHLLALRLSGNPIGIFSSLNLVTLPSMIMNMLLAIPAYFMMGDLAGWLHPEELEV